MENSNRFYVTKSHTIDAAEHLLQIGYEEHPAVIFAKDDDAEPIKIFIDTEELNFYFVDDAALKNAEEIVEHKHNQKVQTGLITNILNWK